MIKKIIFITFLLSLAATQPSQAEIMRGNNLKLQTDMFESHTNKESKTQTSSVEQEKEPQTQKSHFKKSTQNTIMFTLSQTKVSFGTIMAGEPIFRNLQVSAQSSNGLQLLTSENNALTSTNEELQIPDTTCDTGTCTQTTAGVWKNPLSYGFGYRCTNENNLCSEGFEKENTYKQFPNEAETENLEAIIKTHATENINAELTLKVNTSRTHSNQKYNNRIKLIALPNY